MISAILAISSNLVIGRNNNLPWSFKSDMAHFRAKTRDASLIMGKNTYTSIGKPLEGRENIVVSQTPEIIGNPKIIVKPSLDEAIKAATRDEIFIIGGRRLYAEAIPTICDRVYITVILHTYEGDVFFPHDLIRDDDWRISDMKLTSEAGIDLSFITLDRK